MRHFTKALFVLISLGATFAATAQSNIEPTREITRTSPAFLVADTVFLNGNSTLIAKGHVEALFGDTRLKASKIIYDRSTDTLSITGPITLIEGENTLILASSAELGGDLQNGLLLGARLVMNQQLQLAAKQINLVNGRYTQLYKTAVTSCRVCNSSQPPLWQIRAKRVIHDKIERQLYFDNAQFLIRNVPVFYLPRLRLPDPTLKRASGFLIPSIRRNSQLGTGMKIPYFLRFGDHKDLTLTPYLSKETRTLEFNYRQAFRKGRIFINGAVSKDTLLPTQTRAYVFAGGEFDLGHDFKLDFDVEATNDNAYLFDYRYSDKDRLDSEISISRTRRDEFMRAALTQYHSLRVTENNSTLPTLIGDLTYERRFFPKYLGGQLRLGAAAHAHYRYSNLTTDGTDTDIWADGRDVTRLNANASWQRTWTLAGGIRATTLASIAVDSYKIAQIGNTALAAATKVTPALAVTLRWPFRKTTQSGASHVIEPMVQLAWVGGNNPDIPNDESTRVEFDEGNLLSISRYPSVDIYERGASAAIGVHWTRFDPNGWSTGLTFGQIFRDTRQSDFTNSSGLNSTVSNLLVAGQFKNQNGLSLTARGLFKNSMAISKAEARAGWKNTKLSLGASYVWLGTDLAEDRSNTVSEWSIDGAYRLSRHWTGTANVRYDVASNTTAQAGIGLQYRNECVDITLSASRRFTSSIILTPSTDFSFTVGLRGFSAKSNDKSYTRTCSN